MCKTVCIIALTVKIIGVPLRHFQQLSLMDMQQKAILVQVVAMHINFLEIFSFFSCSGLVYHNSERKGNKEIHLYLVLILPVLFINEYQTQNFVLV